MTTSEKYTTLKRACDEQKVCQLNYGNERNPWYIRPLGICLTFKRGMVVVCCVENIDSASDKNPGTVANLPLEDCHQIRITDKGFHVLPDILEQARGCDDWLFHVQPAVR